MTTDNSGEEVVEIIDYYDILQTPYFNPLPCNIDLTKSGWFRILPRLDNELEWKYGGTIEIKELPHPTNNNSDKATDANE